MRYYKDRDFPEIKRNEPGAPPTIFPVTSDDRHVHALLDELNRLDTKLSEQASSHGLYITQTVESQIERLEDEKGLLCREVREQDVCIEVLEKREATLHEAVGLQAEAIDMLLKTHKCGCESITDGGWTCPAHEIRNKVRNMLK